MTEKPTYEELEKRVHELERAEFERKRAEEAFLSERNILRNIFESIEDGIYIVNQQYDIQYVNPVLVKDFGPYEDVKCYRYFHNRDKVCPWCKNQDVWAGKTVRWEWYSFKNERTYDLIDTPMTLSDGSIGKLEIFRDITDRKRLENALMQKEKLKTLGAIAAEVAHEIRNPLVSIGGFAQRLKQKLPELPECDIILTESERLEKILSRVRNYLEPVEIRPQECSVNTIISDCLILLSPVTAARQVKFLLDLAPELPAAHVDPQILNQIFINLIRNATEAMDKGRTLHIKSFESDRELHIEFKNQAPGLRIKHPETIFMPFAQGGQSFGLPLSYRLLKDMGGLLSFTQDNDCIIFTVSLPKIVEPSPDKKEFEED